MRSLRARLFSYFNLTCVDFFANVRGTVELGRGSYVAQGSHIIAEKGDKIVFGKRCHVHVGVVVASYGGNIKIGNNVRINPYSVIYGHGCVEIGDDVLIAAHTVIVPANHKFDRLDLPIRLQGLSTKGIKIESDVWLGARVTVLDGVTIGRGCVVGAGAVVTKDIAPFSIAVGAPARVICSRAG